MKMKLLPLDPVEIIGKSNFDAIALTIICIGWRDVIPHFTNSSNGIRLSEACLDIWKALNGPPCERLAIMVDIRAFTVADLPRVLQFLGEANALTDFHFPFHPGDFLHRLSNGLRGQNADKYNFLYEDNGELIALLLIDPKDEPVFEVLIHPRHRTPELENTLIAWTEQTQQAHFTTANHDHELVMDVSSEDTLRRDVLTQRGYHIEEQPYLHCTARALSTPIPESTLPTDFHIRSTVEADVEQICAVHMSAFDSTWTVEEYLRTMRTPGFDPGRELVVVAPDGRFAAFLIYWPDPISKSGLFEPVGCAKTFQRRGLTRALMYEGMRRMVAAGMSYAQVLHESEALNPASGPFYNALGYSHRFDYRKTVKRLV